MFSKAFLQCQRKIFVLCLLFLTSGCASLQGAPESDAKDRVFYINYRDGGPIGVESISLDSENQRILNFQAHNLDDDALGQPEQIMLSPTGKKLLFSSYWNRAPDISVMNTDGTAWRRLTNTPDAEYEPRWSPDGKRILYRKVLSTHNQGQIWIMNADGSQQRPLLKRLFCGDHRWSPSGKHILFTCAVEPTYKAAIFTINTDGTGLKQLTSGSYMSLEPRWSPDGKAIAYVAYRQGYDAGTNEIELISSNGGNPQVLTQLNQLSYAIRWAPDGQSIVFVSYDKLSDDSQHQLYHLNLNRGTVHAFTQGDWSHIAPNWSRNGERLLCMAYNYEVAPYARLEIYNKQGMLLKTLVPKHGRAYWPSWKQ